MTYEEAIEILQEERDYAQFPKYVREAIEIANSAIKKQIPKKPIYEDIGNVYGAIKRTCAKCGDVCLISEGAKPFEHYCRYCGQALDFNSNGSDTE